jgi:hypothetical protein
MDLGEKVRARFKKGLMISGRDVSSKTGFTL